MKRTIDKPKVFISYAWSSDDYKQKIVSFATALMQSAVDVVLDQWSLEPGNDTYSFMEQSVNDPAVTNVLIMLDKVYKEKADGRTGGVGTETQIISPEIYGIVNQTKFIPVVFERGDNGEICKPTFLTHALHFDLSQEETFTTEFQRLVRWLYGIKQDPKPEISSAPPTWLEQSSIVPVKNIIAYQSLDKIADMSIKTSLLEEYLEKITDSIQAFSATSDDNADIAACQKIINQYNQTKAIRDSYLQLLSNAKNIATLAQYIRDFFENTNRAIYGSSANTDHKEMQYILMKELFIYTISYFLKNKDYNSVYQILSYTYIDSSSIGANTATFTDLIYVNDDRLSSAMRFRDNRRYYNGTGALWVENISEKFSVADLVFADEMIYNYCVLSAMNAGQNIWFPALYIYRGRGSCNNVQEFAVQMKSRERLSRVIALFGYNDADTFIRDYTAKYAEYINSPNEINRGYPEDFGIANVLFKYIKPDDMGKLN